MFVGRESEMKTLKNLLKKTSASMVTVRGRRRIGKTRLIQEFAKGHTCWSFSGIPPEKGMTHQHQIDLFIEQLSQITGAPKIQATSWMEVFTFLASLLQKQKLILVFDEISWMGSKDKHFLGYLKNAWDMQFSRNLNLILILCGSVSSWIEENILKSTGFVGRVSVDIQLGELSLKDSNQFWRGQKNFVSAFEKCKFLCVTGGIPKYLEEMDPHISAEENIHRLCFEKTGFLYREFDQIFSDLFGKQIKHYRKIATTLADKTMSLEELCLKMDIKKGGFVSKRLQNLIISGFVSEIYHWDLHKNKKGRLKLFRLSDNYLRFYLKYLEPNRTPVIDSLTPFDSLQHLPNWDTVMGLQFENLVLNNIRGVCAILRIPLKDIRAIGPYFQRKTTKQDGCQVDLLIQTRTHTLYVCEIKFSMHEIGSKVLEEVRRKVERMTKPKSYTIRPILIHVNGVSTAVREAGFFADIIDFGQFFE